MNKKGTLTSRTLEKLGFRFRSNSQSGSTDDLDPGRSDESDPNKKSSVTTITAGELDISADLVSRYSTDNLNAFTDKKSPSQKRSSSLREKFLGSRHGERTANSIFYSSSLDDMVTTTVGAETSTSGNQQTNSPMHEKKKKVQPEGTNEYTVKDSDTLERIAAHFDTTPSELKKINRLISSVIFPGQVLYVPDEEYVKARTASLSKSDEANENTTPTVFGSPADRPAMDVPLIRAVNSSPTKIPGHAERQTPVSSPKDGLDFEMPPPHKLSEDEVQQLDKDCLERFIKLNVKHITDGQGVVKGVLLVTPNAVMFDPNVSDPLVLEHGSEKYGMIAPMDLIISAAMYHDIAAMKQRGKKEDGTTYPKPEIYHDKSCPMAKQRLEQSQQTSKVLENIIPDKIQNMLRNPLNKSESVCSCGQGGMEADFGDVFEEEGKVESENAGKSDEENEGQGNKLDEEGNECVAQDTVDKSTAGSVGGAEGEEEVKKVTDGEKVVCVSSETKEKSPEKSDDSDSALASEKKVDAKNSPTQRRNQKKLAVSFSVPDSECSNAGSSEAEIKTDVKTETATDGHNAITSQTSSSDGKSDNEESAEGHLQSVDKETVESGKTSEESNGQKDETRIGSIVYLPVQEDVNGKVTVEAIEDTKNTLTKMSANEFSQASKSDSNLADSSAKLENQEREKTRSSSSSSLGPFSPTPHLSAFVNYATGFFQRTASDNNIKDIKEAGVDSVTSSSDIPVVASAPSRGRRRGKISRHYNMGMDVEVENAVSMDEKPDLLTMDYDLAEFAPKQSVAYPDPPLYLCLRLGTPQNKNMYHNYSIESYGKRRKKSEYWFSIPREKVDHLYAFFVQWTPEIYGDEDELTAEKRGFVVIDEGEEDGEDLEMLDEHFGPNSSFQKDWEIISASEALKRQSIVFDEPIPLPELIGESTILTEEHVAELVQVMPGRTVGYPWTLMYSTDKHGFSLKTLYRDMQGLESPILIVVKDTNDMVFGAMTSCELKISDHFYGTGETFLYTFQPDFRFFPWTGENNFFIKGNKESLSIGAGQGVYGLWFDEDLYHGRTNKCETFSNDILTLAEDFVVKGLEAWAFVWS